LREDCPRPRSGRKDVHVDDHDHDDVDEKRHSADSSTRIAVDPESPLRYNDDGPQPGEGAEGTT
jgi:hypothetical protein